MAVPLALPLAPVVVSSGPAATAAAATFVIGSTLHLADTLYGFRRSSPTLPPLTGLEGVATLQEMVADALAGARVPVGFPLPPPWRPEGSALGLAAASLGLWGRLTDGLAQLWGLFGKSADLPPGYEPPSVERYIQGAADSPTGLPGVFVVSWTIDEAGFLRTGNYFSPNTAVRVDILREFWDVPDWPGKRGYAATIRVYDASGTNTNSRVIRGDASNGPWLFGGDVAPVYELSIDLIQFTDQSGSQSVPLLPLPNPQQVEPVEVAPAVSPAFLPQPSPLPRPATVPQVVPEVQPEIAPVEPGPTRSAPPLVLPAPQPLPLPGADPSRVTVQSGALPAAAPLPVPTTDPGSIIPWPGAAPIPGTGPAPAPTLQGIAQEVGRIERKIEVMMSPNAPGNLIDKFDLLQDLIRPIVELILAAQSGTTYTLDSPCEVDAEGNRLPAVEVEAPGALTQFGAILNRVDALAELLQVHKDLKQPNCRGADVPVGGEFVTVNFEQID
jgi:hypothetical protein